MSAFPSLVQVYQRDREIYFGVPGSNMMYFDLESIVDDYPNLKDFVSKNYYDLMIEYHRRRELFGVLSSIL